MKADRLVGALGSLLTALGSFYFGLLFVSVGLFLVAYAFEKRAPRLGWFFFAGAFSYAFSIYLASLERVYFYPVYLLLALGSLFLSVSFWRFSPFFKAGAVLILAGALSLKWASFIVSRSLLSAGWGLVCVAFLSSEDNLKAQEKSKGGTRWKL